MAHKVPLLIMCLIAIDSKNYAFFDVHVEQQLVKNLTAIITYGEKKTLFKKNTVAKIYKELTQEINKSGINTLIADPNYEPASFAKDICKKIARDKTFKLLYKKVQKKTRFGYNHRTRKTWNNVKRYALALLIEMIQQKSDIIFSCIGGDFFIDNQLLDTQHNSTPLKASIIVYFYFEQLENNAIKQSSPL